MLTYNSHSFWPNLLYRAPVKGRKRNFQLDYFETERENNECPRMNEPLSILEISLSNFDIYT